MALDSLIRQLMNESDLDHDRIKQLKRTYAKQHQLSTVPSNVQLIQAYKHFLRANNQEINPDFLNLLKKRSIRSQSGIVPIQVLTKPFRCPGECIFCPNDFTMPKSYINTEPGAMRALLNNFDPIKQVHNRLLSLTLTGHTTDKIEMIVLGGTRDVYPQEYKLGFVKGLYDACNSFPDFIKATQRDETKSRASSYTTQEFPYSYPDTIEGSLEINETAKHRIIGLTVETRPEYVTDENCQFRRTLGVTRIEMGIQSMFDDVLTANKRGHTVQQAREAMHKLRQYGFKISVHIMPGLYTSTVQKDIDTFRLIYEDPWIKPDEIKFYPTSVIPNTVLYELYAKGEYKPLETQDIVHIIKEVRSQYIPAYTRIKRLIRDIPSTEIIAGSNITNLNQLTTDAVLKEYKTNTILAQKIYTRLYPDLKKRSTFEERKSSLQELMEKTKNHPSHITTAIIGGEPDLISNRNFVSIDTRSREIRHKTKNENSEEILVIRTYRSSVGTELFIAYEDTLGYLLGFTRLLMPDEDHTINREGLGRKTALIRELHVYGQLQSLIPVTHKSDTAVQHTGIGSRLMSHAEDIVQNCGYQKLSVISGIGVRGYYKKLGYDLQGTYLVKTFL